MDFKNLNQEYEKKGFIVLRNLISKKNLSKINHSLKIFAKRYSLKNKKNLNRTKNLKINSIHNMEDWVWVRKLRKNKVINTVVKTLIAEKTKKLRFRTFCKTSKTWFKISGSSG